MGRLGPLEKIRDRLILEADKQSAEKSREKLLLMAADLQKLIEDKKKTKETKPTPPASKRFEVL